MTTSDERFERLVSEALTARFAGWDFSYLRHRQSDITLPWDYLADVRNLLSGVTSLLDMDTGDGEVLASLCPLPVHTCATEGYNPNLVMARKRLAPLGVNIVATTEDPQHQRLPFRDGEFQLITNRHGAFHKPELGRILCEGGHFITQQVGCRNNIALNTWLKANSQTGNWTLDTAVELLRDSGFQIEDATEAFPETTFIDIGAIVYYLRAIPWQVQGFSVERYRDRLLEMHRYIEEHGGLTIQSHRFYLCAKKK